jgi:hypothetical protein
MFASAIEHGNSWRVAVAWLSLVSGLAGVMAGLYLFVDGFRLLKRKQRMADMPVTKVAGAAIGPVEIFGTVVGPYTLLSPLAETECFYYCAVATGGEDMEGRPKQSARESMFTPFFLEDETGHVMIDPRGAQLELPAEYDSRGIDAALDDSYFRFLGRHGLLEASVVRLEEFTIKPGDELFVMGCLAENRGFASMADAQLGRFPAPGEGYLSAPAASLQKREMLEGMGVAPQDLPSIEPNIDAKYDLHPRVLVRKGDEGEPFILARRRPKWMVEDLARRATRALCAGPALVLLSLGVMLAGLDLW